MRVKLSTNESVNKELQSLVKQYEACIEAGGIVCGNAVVADILNFRYKLAANRGTEYFESYYGWTAVFDEMQRNLKV